jgi:5-(carboxyamino)imidazole ribonucleotide mutase
MNQPDVAILVGATSDMHVAEKAIEVIKDAGITYEVEVISAHRDPIRLDEYLREVRAKVYIVSSKLSGLDALLSIAQMPAGVPVASVGIDNGKNAALLALRILQVNVEVNKVLDL